MNFSLSQLAESVVRRDMNADAQRLTAKWEKTALLEGLSGVKRVRIAQLLENQANELVRGQSAPQVLQEANAISTGAAGLTSSGQLAGFTNVAFPIVRKVFAGLVANELVSVQAMSLPTGLLFYLDYTYGSNVGGDAGINLSSASTNETYSSGTSIYNLPTGASIRGGSSATGGQFGLVGQGYSKVHNQATNVICSTDSIGAWVSGSTWTAASTVGSTADFVGYNGRFVGYNPTVLQDLEANVLDYCFMHVSAAQFTSKITGADINGAVEQIAVTGFGVTAPGGATSWGTNYQSGTGVMNLRGENKRGTWNPITGIFTPDSINGTHIQFVVALSNTGAAPTVGNATTNAVTASAALADALSVDSSTGSTLVVPSFETNFAVDASPRIPEIDIKIESVNVMTTSRKMRARWSPEMAQDITAYFAIDIEEELTNLLSQLITLEIDREILNDLLMQANAANLYWSRSPGKVVNKYTGTEATRATSLSPAPSFMGDVQSWYQVLVETIVEVANTIYKKTLRGSGNFIVTSTEVCTIFESMNGYNSNFKIDAQGQVKDGVSLGAEAAGTLQSRFVVYKDPYFPQNKILVGYKGNTFLETGYIYAPYIPLILTPVIYAQEDFTPRKGIMTRYGKKMIRSDFYGTVTVLDMQYI
jgi:hypothetical protein